MAEHCGCGNIIVVRTSWTDSNPGRRFISCDRCRYFRWIDGPLCEHARIIIPGLLRKINTLEAQVNRAAGDGLVMGLSEGDVCSSQKEVKPVESICGCKTSLSLLILTWIVIFIYCLCKVEEAGEIWYRHVADVAWTCVICMFKASCNEWCLLLVWMNVSNQPKWMYQPRQM